MAGGGNFNRSFSVATQKFSMSHFRQSDNILRHAIAAYRDRQDEQMRGDALPQSSMIPFHSHSSLRAYEVLQPCPTVAVVNSTDIAMVLVNHGSRVDTV